MDSYVTPGGFGEASFEEKRSKFIGRVWPCGSEEQALLYIADMRKKHWDATHNVYAYAIRGGQMRSSDDGEPQGTAGMPVQDVFLKAGVTGFCCVVTRYFGGTLLGAGGLVRAYGAAAKQALTVAGLSKMEPVSVFVMNCPYALFEQMKRNIEARSGGVLDTEYGADVALRFFVPVGEAEALTARVDEISSGGCSVTFVESRHLPVSV